MKPIIDEIQLAEREKTEKRRREAELAAARQRVARMRPLTGWRRMARRRKRDYADLRLVFEPVLAEARGTYRARRRVIRASVPTPPPFEGGVPKGYLRDILQIPDAILNPLEPKQLRR